MTTLLGRSPALAGRRRLSGQPLAVALLAAVAVAVAVAVVGVAPGLFRLAAGMAPIGRSGDQAGASLRVVERDTVAMIDALAKPGTPDTDRLRQHLLQAIDGAAAAMSARGSPVAPTDYTGRTGVSGGAASHFGPAQRATGYARAALGYARAGALAGDARLLARGRDLLRLAQRPD